MRKVLSKNSKPNEGLKFNESYVYVCEQKTSIIGRKFISELKANKRIHLTHSLYKEIKQHRV